MYDPGVGPVHSNSSARDMEILTGLLPAFCDNSAAIGSPYGSNFPPNPPPISNGVSFTSVVFTSSISAVASRIWNGPWVLFQI